MYKLAVALRTEGVDRNRHWFRSPLPSGVALRTEGVDRNCDIGIPAAFAVYVALRTEGVDRNEYSARVSDEFMRRPPHGGRG